MSEERNGSASSPHQLAKAKSQSKRQSQAIGPNQNRHLATLSAAIQECHARAQVHLAASVLAAMSTGEKLLEVKALLPHGEFLKWIDSELTPSCNLSRRSAQRYMQLSDRRQELVDRIRSAYSVEPDRELTLEEAEGVLATLRMKDAHSLLPPRKKDRNTAKSMESAKTPPANFDSEPHEYDRSILTPEDILEAATSFLGRIDLDPCAESSVKPSVPAANHYTQAEDGLSDNNPWRGRVFIHPPNDDSIERWLVRATGEFVTESIDEALLLLPDSGAACLRTVDTYPRVYVRRLSKQSLPYPCLVVGLIRPVRLADFHAGFSKLGSLFVPYRYADEY